MFFGLPAKEEMNESFSGDLYGIGTQGNNDGHCEDCIKHMTKRE
jgi:hypothetical protein